MSKKRTIIAFVLSACILMAWVDGSKLDYVTKALLKILTFSLIPLIYFKVMNKMSLRSLFQVKLLDLRIALILGCVLYTVILLIYFFSKQDLRG